MLVSIRCVIVWCCINGFVCVLLTFDECDCVRPLLNIINCGVNFCSFVLFCMPRVLSRAPVLLPMDTTVLSESAFCALFCVFVHVSILRMLVLSVCSCVLVGLIVLLVCMVFWLGDVMVYPSLVHCPIWLFGFSNFAAWFIVFLNTLLCVKVMAWPCVAWRTDISVLGIPGVVTQLVVMSPLVVFVVSLPR